MAGSKRHRNALLGLAISSGELSSAVTISKITKGNQQKAYRSNRWQVINSHILFNAVRFGEFLMRYLMIILTCIPRFSFSNRFLRYSFTAYLKYRQFRSSSRLIKCWCPRSAPTILKEFRSHSLPKILKCSYIMNRLRLISVPLFDSLAKKNQFNSMFYMIDICYLLDIEWVNGG